MNKEGANAAELRRIADELLTMADAMDASAGVRFAPAAPPDPARRDVSDRAIANAAYRARRARARFLPHDLFFEPAWDMLLDLYVAACDGKSISTTSLCIASATPPTTALRYVNQLIDLGLAGRREDPKDARRTLVYLSERGHKALSSYFRALRLDAFGGPPELMLIRGNGAAAKAGEQG